jgi:hypothetical protein
MLACEKIIYNSLEVTTSVADSEYMDPGTDFFHPGSNNNSTTKEEGKKLVVLAFL